MDQTESFDYIVIGAGSSGATVANRLAAQPGTRVLLLEAGAPRQNDFWVRTPLGIGKLLLNPDYVWPFETEPQAALDGKRIYWPRGRLPGGSSSVNGMIYVRGEPSEYDHWRDGLGNPGWGYDDLLPYFKRMESYADGDDALRGRSGPIGVTNLAHDPSPLGDAFVAACQQAGIPKSADYNGRGYEGVSYLQLSTRGGERCSTARGYLAKSRPQGLDLRTEAQATRLLFEGRRAVGVDYVHKGVRRTARARVEVILSAGPIKSPQLLELSGIGQAERLRALGIAVLHDLPGVGENLCDHLQGRITFECTERITLNEIMQSPLRQGLMGARYLLTRRGVMATPSASAHALARFEAGQDRPMVKVQMHHLSGADRYSRTKGAGMDLFPGFAIGFFNLRPASRGWVHATNPDALTDPAMEPRYLTHDEDRATMLGAIKLSRAISQQPALARLVKRETRPGIDVRADEELLDYIRTCGQTSWHPIGTCKMGHDPLAVVDAELRVHGVEGLRVVDSSIMPTMPSSNTNAGSIAIGEKAADLILSSARGRGAGRQAHHAQANRPREGVPA
ncbi:GMC family oxidoreductase N-terminal domain-containing protein [Pigmentiphaga sp.]|uniref:GMC family oxidoreductase n=1 Tax=Pigmentiphaga sp. TaxID=1977564 RepID=UPI0025D945FD|nr:GMC family oxidoreductase N-terminal domain-containing protein [Pigmentiphaga sp.]